MKFRLLGVASVAVLMTTLGAANASAVSTTSSAGPIREQTAGIEWVSSRAYVKKTDRDKAVLRLQYRCDGVGVHLWASLKQGSGVDHYRGTTDRPSPPSEVARAWYETPEEARPTCDGHSHTLRYTVTRATEGTKAHPGEWKRLKNGKAWAQIVVFSVPAGTDPNDQNVQPHREAFAGWVRVVS